MKRIGMALIGCGRIAYKHCEALTALDDRVVLQAACDLKDERAHVIAQQYKATQPTEAVEVCSQYRQLLNRDDIDAVAIATESGNHAEIALAFLRAGKHVLVEKPMALSTAHAEALIAEAEVRGLKLAVAHQNRFNPAVQMLHKAVKGGRFGRLIAGNARVLWNRSFDYYAQAGWRGTYAQDGGCLMNQCIHNIDLLQWMLGGNAQYVQAMLGNFTHPYIEAEDYGSLQIRFAGGAIGNVEGTVSVYPNNLEETLTVIGERGTAVIGGLALNKVQVWQFADGLDSLEHVQQCCNSDVDSVYGDGHTPLYENWIRAILNDGRLVVDGREGMKALSIILHGYEAERRAARIAIGQTQLQCSDYLGGVALGCASKLA